MSDGATGTDRDLVEYVRARTRLDDAFLSELKREARAAEIPAIWVAEEQAVLIAVLLRSMGARRVVEVGTLAGSTAIAMARALEAGGRVDTIEISPVHAAFARTWVARSDVADRVVVHEGAASDVLPGLEDGAYDAMLVDADKSGYADYLAHARRLLRPHGLLLVDNAFAFGHVLEANTADRDVAAVRSFNDLAARQDWLRAVIVPIGDGMWVGTKEAT
ncbi:MAG: O-methyltransferase [Planctomycetota bacterium]